MELSKLFQLQQILDHKIIEHHNLGTQNLNTKNILALQVGLGKLANETRCFKYWSHKKISNKQITLEEYIDCLHFILTIGLENNYTDITHQLPDCKFDLTSQFINLFVDINDFWVCSSKDNYITLFTDFINLGKSLCFSLEEIEKAYLEKNYLNQSRQK